MIRAILIAMLLASPASAQDNNPFSGAREIRVVMVRERPTAARYMRHTYTSTGHRTFSVTHKSGRKLKRAARYDSGN